MAFAATMALVLPFVGGGGRLSEPYGFWNTYWIERRISRVRARARRGQRFARGERISPVRSLCRPAMERASVVFPEPDSPTSARHSCGASSSVTSWTTGVPEAPGHAMQCHDVTLKHTNASRWWASVGLREDDAGALDRRACTASGAGRMTLLRGRCRWPRRAREPGARDDAAVEIPVRVPEPVRLAQSARRRPQRQPTWRRRPRSFSWNPS